MKLNYILEHLRKKSFFASKLQNRVIMTKFSLLPNDLPKSFSKNNYGVRAHCFEKPLAICTLNLWFHVSRLRFLCQYLFFLLWSFCGEALKVFFGNLFRQKKIPKMHYKITQYKRRKTSKNCVQGLPDWPNIFWKTKFPRKFILKSPNK